MPLQATILDGDIERLLRVTREMPFTNLMTIFHYRAVNELKLENLTHLRKLFNEGIDLVDAGISSKHPLPFYKPTLNLKSLGPLPLAFAKKVKGWEPADFVQVLDIMQEVWKGRRVIYLWIGVKPFEIEDDMYYDISSTSEEQLPF